MPMDQPLAIVLIGSLCLPSAVTAQVAPPAGSSHAVSSASPEPGGAADLEGEASQRMPPREPLDAGGSSAPRPGRAFLQIAAVNGAYALTNLARGQVTARVTPISWWHNLQRGWVWDLDRFLVNQIGHPFQGSQYFSAGRANGLGFFESAALAAFGSGTWEYFGETNHPSLNDFINTSLGGVALGEVLHRTAGLIRGPRGPASSRRWRRVASAAIDPVAGVNHLMNRDGAGVASPPEAIVPRMSGVASTGVLRRGNNLRSRPATVDPFVQVDLTYGASESDRSRTPYDAFAVRFMAGGGGSLTEARIRGRLMAEPMVNERLQFSVVQSYHYLGNDAYRFGAQAFETHVSGRRALTPRLGLVLEGWGGLTVLGAIDSRPLNPSASPSLPDRESAGQGVSEGPRNYDYGPGTTFGASATLTRHDEPFASAQYEGRTLYSLDGIRANHLLQRARADVILPVRGRFGIGATGEFFDRHSFYQDAAATVRRYYFPQLRLYLTWRLP